MHLTYGIARWMVFLFIIVPRVSFSENKVIFYLDDVKIYPDHRAYDVITSKTVSFTKNCDGTCKDKISISPLTRKVREEEGGGSLTVESGLKGVNINIKKISETKDNAEFSVSVIRGSTSVLEGGMIDSLQPVALLMMDNREVGQIYVSGNVYTSACEVTSGNITMNLGMLSVTEVRSHAINHPVTTGSQKASIDVNCTPGSVNDLNLVFSAINYNGKIIKPSEDMGVGFMLRNGLDDSWIGFGQDNSIAVRVTESGRISVPFDAYYVRYSDNVKAGEFSAKAQYTITYK